MSSKAADSALQAFSLKLSPVARAGFAAPHAGVFNRYRFMRAYSLCAAAMAWSFLLLWYFAGAHWQSAEQTVNYFSYFSILSNLFAATVLTAAALPLTQGAWLRRSSVVAGITLYMTLTGLPFILTPPWVLQDWFAVANSGLHHVMPVMFLLFWLLFVPKGTLALRHTLVWLIFPLGFGVYSLLRGVFSGSYPYLFLNIDELGLNHVLIEMFLMSVRLLSLGVVLVVLDNKLGQAQSASDENMRALPRT